MADYWGVIIGAAGALAGTLATGGFTLLKGRQDRAVKKMEIGEQRSSRHRDIRRDAYSQFLTQLSKIEESLKKILETPILDLTLDSTPSEEYRSRVDSLTDSFNVVFMEGPENVANIAAAIQTKTIELHSEITTFIAANSANAPANRKPPSEVEPTIGRQRSEEISLLKKDLMVAARSTL